MRCWYEWMECVCEYEYIQNQKKKEQKSFVSTPERFELSHALHTALAGLRLNHSAKVPILTDAREVMCKQ